MASITVELGITAENTFSIANKQLKLNSKSDIESILVEMEKVNPLKKIDFSGNTIGIEASEQLSISINKKREHLTEIDFSDIYTGRLNTEIPQSLHFLLNSLLNCPNLKLLNLSDNAFGLQTIEPIEDYISKAVSLQHLILSNNGMGPLAGERIGKSLLKLSISQKNSHKSLKTFICGRNRLENGSINHLLIGLKNHKELETLKLYQNGIRPKGIKKLIKHGLSHASNLKVLDLQDNTLTAFAAIELAKNLKNWPSLSELNVNDCLMNPAGSLELVTALWNGPVLPNLHVLKLQYNELDSKSLDLLAKAIEKNLPNLRSLELNGNRFEESAEAIEQITNIFEERGFGEIDELDDLEEVDSEDEESGSEGSSDEEDVDLAELESKLKGDVESIVLDFEKINL